MDFFDPSYGRFALATRHFPGPLRPNKKKVLFSIFRTFPAIFRAPHGVIALANRHFPGPLRPKKRESFIFHTFPAIFRAPHGVIGLANRHFPVDLGRIKRKFYFPHFSGHFPGPSRRNCTSDPPNSGGFRPNKKKVLFSIFRCFSGPLTAVLH